MTTLTDLSEQISGVIEGASKSLVRVDARRRVSGSGVIWDEAGLIVTADHVLERDDDIGVALSDGTELPATIVGRDPSTDLALLKVESKGLAAIARGPAPKVGNLVFALGAASRSLTATSGMVTSLNGRHRSWRASGRGDEIIRTDTALYPGFSGGPLVDAAGRLLGINTSFLAPGASTAVALSAVERVTTALVKGGRVPRPYLGVVSQPTVVPKRFRDSLSLQQETGLLMLGVEAGTPADKAGVLLGDLLIGLDGNVVGHADDLQRSLAGHQPGETVPLKVVRGGEAKEISVTLGERT